MKIGLLHYRVGETDGVSLEMEKWKDVLTKMGNEVFLIGGEIGTKNAIKIPSLSYRDEENMILKSWIFEKNEKSEEEILKKLNELKEKIYEELHIIKNFDILIVNNLFSLAHNIPAALAVYEFSKENKIKVIGHHHDFYWERDYYDNINSQKIKNILIKYFPPKEIKHVVINSIARNNLLNKKNIESKIIPNVFDFSTKEWKKDKYNSKIYSELNIDEKHDIVFLQATRIVKRKGIEMAIDVLSKLNDKIHNYNNKETYNKKIINDKSSIYLILPGLNEESEYFEKLIKYANQKKVKLKFCSKICSDKREKNKFSLWDFYAISDFITYPSLLEGFGNQFLEAVFAKKPILIYEYPVYEKDISKINFNIVSLGNNAYIKDSLYTVSDEKYETAAEKILKIIFSENINEILNNNFKLGKKYYSYSRLEKDLRNLIN
jgi:glycosyltransferase involved in cell wall biosynthesis